MNELLTPDDIYNELIMTRDSFFGSLFLLEGSSDCGVLDKFTDVVKCKTIPAHGKENVLDVVRLAKENGLIGVVGMVDADFDRIRKAVSTSMNVCTTDFHDLEMTLLVAGALEWLVKEYFHSEKTAELLRCAGKPNLLDLVLASGATVGLLRWTSIKQGLNLNFQVLNFSTFLDPETLLVIQSDLIRAVIGDTRSCAASAGSLSADMAKLASNNYDPRQLTCGHDASEILSLAVRSTTSPLHESVATSRKIEQTYRDWFSPTAFKTTVIYTWLKSWEARNDGFLIFRI